MASLKDYLMSICPDWPFDDRVSDVVAVARSAGYGAELPSELFEYIATCIPRKDVVVDRWTILSLESLCEHVTQSVPSELIVRMHYLTIASDSDVYAVGLDGRVYYCDVAFRPEHEENDKALRLQSEGPYPSYDSIRDFFKHLLPGEAILID